LELPTEFNMTKGKNTSGASSPKQNELLKLIIQILKRVAGNNQQK
jgi:hypothetical protein